MLSCVLKDTQYPPNRLMLNPPASGCKASGHQENGLKMYPAWAIIVYGEKKEKEKVAEERKESQRDFKCNEQL